MTLATHTCAVLLTIGTSNQIALLLKICDASIIYNGLFVATGRLKLAQLVILWFKFK